MLRERFPILECKTYLASHSLGAVPRTTEQALREYYQEWAEQGILAWDGPWWAALEEFGARLERLLHAPSKTIVPFQNATRGMAAVASSLDFTSTRNEVLMTDLEFTTAYPFWRSQEHHGAKVVVVKSPDGITVPAELLEERITERTLLVMTSHVYFRSGALQDLRRLSAAAHRMGAYLLGDGYQAAGTVPVDVTDLEVDFYVGGCHKWLCGGPGAGYFYCRPDLIERMQPRMTGWFGLQNPFHYDVGTHAGQLHEGIMRFMCGTANIPGLYAAREGLKTIEEVGVERIREHSLSKTRAIMDQARERQLTVRTPEQRGGMVCLDFPGSKEVTDGLIQRGIVVDWRPDCGLRVSPHFYNDDEDLERFFAELDALRRVTSTP